MGRRYGLHGHSIVTSAFATYHWRLGVGELEPLYAIVFDCTSTKNDKADKTFSLFLMTAVWLTGEACLPAGIDWEAVGAGRCIASLPCQSGEELLCLTGCFRQMPVALLLCM